jgi:predicted nucleic-acid-binding Zn-ribbon protein
MVGTQIEFFVCPYCGCNELSGILSMRALGGSALLIQRNKTTAVMPVKCKRCGRFSEIHYKITALKVERPDKINYSTFTEVNL